MFSLIIAVVMVSLHSNELLTKIGIHSHTHIYITITHIVYNIMHVYK